MVGSLAGSASAANSVGLRLAGADSGVSAMKRVAQGFQKRNPGFSLLVVPVSGSDAGIKALNAGIADMAVISRPLRNEEIADGLVAYDYGSTPFVFATHKKYLEGITVQQAADIYAGKVTRWPDGTPIRVVLRPAAAQDTAQLADFSPEMKQAVKAAHAREGMIMAIMAKDSVQEIERVPGAFGTTTLALILSEKRNVEALPINGVKPTSKALGDGSYPYFKVMRVVVKGDAPAVARQFIDYLNSPEGRAVLAETGHWLPDAKRPEKDEKRRGGEPSEDEPGDGDATR